jgi:hypothetical protein
MKDEERILVLLCKTKIHLGVRSTNNSKIPKEFSSLNSSLTT